MAIDVVITRTNSIVDSPRIRKIAGSLKKRYRTRVIGWNREGIPVDKRSGFLTDLDLMSLRGPIGRTIIVIYLPIFWIYLFGKLLRYQPRVIHACDLDTLLPSLIYKLMFRKKLIFDVCDRYALSKIPPSRRYLYAFVNWLEEYLGRKADCMINVSEERADTFRHKPKRTTIIMNCADDSLKNLIRIDSEKSGLSNIENEDFTLVYTGNIVRKRGLEQISSAIRKIDGVKLIIAGKATDQTVLDELTRQSKIKYCGQLSFPEALGLEAVAGAIVILYDTSIPNNKYANPNKLFEAMMFGIPVITNVVEEIVRETNCGLLVEYGNVEQIATAVTELRDNPRLRRTLGENGKIAFRRRYNWSSMEHTLFDIYDELQKG